MDVQERKMTNAGFPLNGIDHNSIRKPTGQISVADFQYEMEDQIISFKLLQAVAGDRGGINLHPNHGRSLAHVPCIL
jgi:hypothetical protein